MKGANLEKSWMETMATKWKKEKVLGSGSYGKVYLAAPAPPHNSSAFSSSTDLLVAVKSANLDDSSTLQKERMFLGELSGNRNIIQCFGEDISIENNQQVYNLLLEYAAGGSLHDLIKNNKGTIPESHVACYSFMLLNGLYDIHECETVHCDLKPENIMVFPNHQNDAMITNQLKIADFGLAKKSWDDSEVSEWGRMGYNNRCTPIYASPESVMCGLQGTASDVWSLGCIVAEMITGESIWPCKISRSDLLTKLMFEKPRMPENISDDGKDFLCKCFERTVHKRWTAEMLLDHPFIQKNLLKLLEDHGSMNMNTTRDDSQTMMIKNPFGYGDWISTTDLFTTTTTSLDNLKCSSSPFAGSQNQSSEIEESQDSSWDHLNDSELFDMLYRI